MNFLPSSGGFGSGELHPQYGIPKSEESKAKQSAAMSGENNPQYGKTGELCHNTGLIHSEEHKAKISAACSGNPGNNTKLTESEVILIRELYATGDYTQKELASKFGVEVPTISRIISRKRWKHIPR